MQRNLINIALAAFLAAFGSSMYLIAVTWMMYENTKDATYTGMLVGFGFLPGLFLNVFVGIIVDRLNRKRSAVLSNVVSTGAIFVLLVAMLVDAVHPWLLIGVHMVIQLFATLYRPSIQSYLAELFEKKDLPKVYSQNGAAGEVGTMIGASLGGVILATMGAVTCVSVMAGCFIVATISILLTRSAVVSNRVEVEQKAAGAEKTSIVYDLVSGFRYLKGNPLYYGLFLMMFVGQLVVHSSNGLLAVYVSSYLHGTSTLVGAMQSAVSVGGALAGALATWFLYRTGRLVASVSLLIVWLGLGLVAFTLYLPSIFIGVLLIGLGTTWLRVLMQSIQQVATDPAYYGRMASYRMLCNQSSVAIGTPILGMIADHYGANFSYAALMVPVLLSLVFSLYFTSRPRFRGIIQTIVPAQGTSKAM